MAWGAGPTTPIGALLGAHIRGLAIRRSLLRMGSMQASRPPTTSPPHAIVAATLALRLSHPAAPARDVLELVLRDRDGPPLEFGQAGHLPHPFARLVTDAYDDVMSAAEWCGLIAGAAGPAKRRLLEVWRSEVWAPFARCYRLTL
jgi:hypothetical protein